MSAPNVDEQLWRLGHALRGGRLDEWGATFARSVLRQAKRGGPRWEPSPKQAAILERLLREAARPSEPLIDEG